MLIVVTLLGAIAFGPKFASVNNFLNIIEDSSFLALAGHRHDVRHHRRRHRPLGRLDAGARRGPGRLRRPERREPRGGLVLPLVVGVAIGLANGVLIARGRMAPFIVTLGALLFARGLAFFVADNGNTVFLIPDDAWFTQLGQGELLGLSFPIWVAGIAFVIGWIVLQPDTVRHSPSRPSAAARMRPG